VVIATMGALGRWASDDLGGLKDVLVPDHASDVIPRLAEIRRPLVALKEQYEFDYVVTAQTPNPAGVLVAASVAVMLWPDGSDVGDRSHDEMWTFQTAQGWGDGRWGLVDFSAPPVCGVYLSCGPNRLPVPSSPSPYRPVYLSCAVVDPSGVTSFVRYTVALDAAGRPDFAEEWRVNVLSCSPDLLQPEPVVSSPVERAAVAATGSGSSVAKIGTLYSDCAARFDLGAGRFPNGQLGELVGEYRGVLVLCPTHPDVKAIRAAIDAN
jgi:hypothetical protein